MPRLAIADFVRPYFVGYQPNTRSIFVYYFLVSPIYDLNKIIHFKRIVYNISLIILIKVLLIWMLLVF